MSNTHHDTVKMLRQSYCMEIKTVMNYLANSINLDGVRAAQIKQSLAVDIAEELTHAQQLGERIKQLGGQLPGSANVTLGKQPQPPASTTDVVRVIHGVISAEEDACRQYRRIIDATHRHDRVTANLCTRLLADEEERLVLFRGFLKEYEQDRRYHEADFRANRSRPAPVVKVKSQLNDSVMIGLS